MKFDIRTYIPRGYKRRGPEPTSPSRTELIGTVVAILILAAAVALPLLRYFRLH